MQPLENVREEAQRAFDKHVVEGTMSPENWYAWWTGWLESSYETAQKDEARRIAYDQQIAEGNPDESEEHFRKHGNR